MSSNSDTPINNKLHSRHALDNDLQRDVLDAIVSIKHYEDPFITLTSSQKSIFEKHYSDYKALTPGKFWSYWLFVIAPKANKMPTDFVNYFDSCRIGCEYRTVSRMTSRDVDARWIEKFLYVVSSYKKKHLAILLYEFISHFDQKNIICTELIGLEKNVNDLRKFAKGLSGQVESMSEPFPSLNQQSTYKNSPQSDKFTEMNDLWSLSHREVLSCLDEYEKEETQTKQLSDSDLFRMGICHLILKKYKNAISVFEKCLNSSSLDAELYYYYSLSLFQGRRPYRLKIREIHKVVDLLYKTISLDQTKAKYFYFLYIINEDYYRKTGIKPPELSSKELLSTAAKLTFLNHERTNLIEHLNIEDERILINIKQG